MNSQDINEEEETRIDIIPELDINEEIISENFAEIKRLRMQIAELNKNAEYETYKYLEEINSLKKNIVDLMENIEFAKYENDILNEEIKKVNIRNGEYIKEIDELTSQIMNIKSFHSNDQLIDNLYKQIDYYKNQFAHNLYKQIEHLKSQQTTHEDEKTTLKKEIMKKQEDLLTEIENHRQTKQQVAEHEATVYQLKNIIRVIISQEKELKGTYNMDEINMLTSIMDEPKNNILFYDINKVKNATEAQNILGAVQLKINNKIAELMKENYKW